MQVHGDPRKASVSHITYSEAGKRETYDSSMTVLRGATRGCTFLPFSWLKLGLGAGLAAAGAADVVCFRVPDGTVLGGPAAAEMADAVKERVLVGLARAVALRRAREAVAERSIVAGSRGMQRADRGEVVGAADGGLARRTSSEDRDGRQQQRRRQ